MNHPPYPPEELIALTAKLAWKYTGSDSTSMTYERAQSLMGAVIYCLNIYSRQQTDALAKTAVPAQEAYQAGYEWILSKMRQLVWRYEQLAADFEDYGLMCLHDTVCAGLPEFLRRYDARFAPQETILSLDYPVFADLSGLSGVEAIWVYTDCIVREQAFLRRFDRQYVIWLLKQYHPHYEELVENVCGLVLQNTLGHLLLAKPLSAEGFSPEERDRLGQMLLAAAPQEAEALLTNALCRLLGASVDNDSEELGYLRRSLPDIACRARQAAASGHLEHIFVW